MAKAKTFWIDHVTNSSGGVIQQGTPINAANLNKLEDTVQQLNVAYDMMTTITQAELRDKEKRIATLEAQLAALSS